MKKITTFLLSLCFLTGTMPAWAQYTDEVRVILDPKEQTLISSEVTATLMDSSKHMGARFTKGEVLLRLDDVFYEAALTEAEARVQGAEVELKARQELYNDGAASVLELTEAMTNLSIAKAQMQQADKKYRACTPIAPYSGKVVSVAFKNHELAREGQPLIEIVDDSSLTAKFLISPDKLSDLVLGQKIEVKVRETQSTVNAIISRISPIIDATSSTVKVEAEIDNTQGLLKGGMTGTTTLKAVR